MFKSKTPRDPKYLAFIRTLPCIRCGSNNCVAAHHTEGGGMALKGSDYSVLPLCLHCHNLIHAQHGKAGFWGEEELKRIILDLRVKYTTRGKHGEEAG